MKNVTVDLNKPYFEMNKYEEVARVMMWSTFKKHSTLCNMFDALVHLAELNPENGEFTAHDIGASGSTLRNIMSPYCPKEAMIFTVARKVPCKINIPVWVWDEPREFEGGITGEGHNEFKEIDKEMNVYKMQWSVDELREFIKIVSKMARVIV